MKTGHFEPVVAPSSETVDNKHKQPALTRPSRCSQLPVKRRGEVAEAAFLHKAAALGFSVAKPWGESDRYDFIVENGAHSWRVQVKSAYSHGKAGYSFRACGANDQTYTTADTDFFVAYIVPNDLWYVVPIEVFSKGAGMKFFPNSKYRRSRFEKYREAWCLMACPKDGLCRKEIDVERCCQQDTGGGGVRCPKEG